MPDPAKILREYAASEHAETMGYTVVSRRALNEAADEIERLRAELRDADRWMFQHPAEYSKDHACEKCYPHSDILVGGFTCAYHRAKARYLAEQLTAERV